MGDAIVAGGTASQPGSGEKTMREAFTSAMRKAVSTVCVVATAGPAGRYGVTVSAMTSVTADPPSVLICINQGNFVIPAVIKNGCFSVNFLHEGQEDISEVFAGRRPAPTEDRFSCAHWENLCTGSPGLVGAAATFDCALAEQIEFGSHILFIGSVIEVRANDAPTLVYHDRNYRKLAS